VNTNKRDAEAETLSFLFKEKLGNKVKVSLNFLDGNASEA
jgi:hypothetical protein